MVLINYLLKGFGFSDWYDFEVSGLKFLSIYVIKWAVLFGSIEMFITEYLGFDIIVGFVWFILIIAEFVTGMLVSKRNGEEFKSRLFGRMLFKMGFYILILFVLNSLANHYHAPQISGIELDPFLWIYHVFFVGVIYQFILSLAENGVALGFKELKPFVAVLKAKIGKYFKTTEDE